MTVRERVLASRLIEKIGRNGSFAKQVGLSFVMATGTKAGDSKTVGNRGRNIWNKRKQGGKISV